MTDASHSSRRGDYAAGRAALIEGLGQALETALSIKPRMSGSEWAEEFGVLPQGTSAEPGKIRLYGYQRGMLDEFCNPDTPLVTVKKSARVGYTRLCQLAVAYHIEHDPSSCVIVQPTIPDAEDFGRKQIQPLIAETPELAALIRPLRKGDAQDTLTDIVFSNGAQLMLRGAASDDAFRRYDARLQVADEIDANGWQSTRKGSQGSKLKKLWKRGETYWNRKQIRGSTPLLDGASLIDQEWERSDKRHYFVPCPHCSAKAGKPDGFQYLEWGGPDVPFGFKWSLSEEGDLEEVWYVCRHCGCVIDESSKEWMDAHGEWIPTAKPKTPGHVGFFAWTAMSLQPGAAWKTLVQEWLEAVADPADKMQPFVNETLGRTYKATYGQELKVERFASRVEPYPFEVPTGVRYLTAGVDTQSGEGKDPRLEVSVYGWGHRYESWLIGHWIIRGDPKQPETWDDLDRQVLLRSFIGADGKMFKIQAACVDSGGHNTQEVYAFCAPRSARRVWAIKGRSETAGKRNRVWPRKPSARNGNTLYLIGGNAARDFVYASLAVERPGPRYVHFPADPPSGAEPLDNEFFAQLTRERLVTRKGAYTEWQKPKEAHEAGVCLVYAYAAVCGLQALGRRWMSVLEKGAPAPADDGPKDAPADGVVEVKQAPSPEPAAKTKPRRQRAARGNMLQGL